MRSLIPSWGYTVGLDKKTVERYIYFFEQCFIVYRLGAFSKNLRTGLKRAFKVYFSDNGIRNALANNFNPLERRSDTGSLWENYFITERRKQMYNERANFTNFFWRTTAQQEIDFLEIEDGKLRGYEIKWESRTKYKITAAFAKSYPAATVSIVNPDSYLDFLIDFDTSQTVLNLCFDVIAVRNSEYGKTNISHRVLLVIKNVMEF